MKSQGFGSATDVASSPDMAVPESGLVLSFSHA
jgi:hypothetical protein